jgi:uncharacterized membrane protein YfcA
MNGWLIIFGFLAGIVGGMGMGGGVVLVPLLTIFWVLNKLLRKV